MSQRPPYDEEECTSVEEAMGYPRWPGFFLVLAFVLMLCAAAYDRLLRLFRIPKRETSPNRVATEWFKPSR